MYINTMISGPERDLGGPAGFRPLWELATQNVAIWRIGYGPSERSPSGVFTRAGPTGITAWKLPLAVPTHPGYGRLGLGRSQHHSGFPDRTRVPFTWEQIRLTGDSMSRTYSSNAHSKGPVEETGPSS